MAQTAYELERFRNRPLKNDQPKMRAVRGKKQALKVSAEKVKVIAVCVIMAGLTMGVLESQATITELTSEIQSTNKALVNAQSDYNYLSGVMDSKTGLKNVEQIATSTLGLMKLDKSQITYVALESESLISRPESSTKKMTGFLQNFLQGLMDYLNP